MNGLISIISILLLTIIVFQDFKYRQIFWVTLPALFLLFTAQSYFQNGLTYTALYFIVNVGFVVFIFLTGVLLVAIAKKKSLKETFKTFTGIGDVLFFLVICTAFSPFMYLAYCAISAVVAILGYVAYNSIMKKATASLPAEQVGSPFAGVMALSLIFFIVLKQFNPAFDFYNDELVANVLRFG